MTGPENSKGLESLPAESLTDDALLKEVGDRTDVEKQIVEDLNKPEKAAKYTQLVDVCKKLEGEMFKGFDFTSQVDKIPDLLHNKVIFARLVAAINEKLEEKDKKTIKENAGNIMSIVEGDSLSPVEKDVSYDEEGAYDLFVCMSAYEALNQAQKQFDKDYQNMDKVVDEKFKDSKIGFSINSDAEGKTVYKFDVPPELQTAYDAVAKGEPKTEAQRKDEEIAMVDALKGSKVGKMFSFLLRRKDESGLDGYERIAQGKGGMLEMIVGFIAEFEGVKGFENGTWDGLKEMVSSIPWAGGAAVGAAMTKFGDSMSNWAKGKKESTEVAGNKTLTSKEFIEQASAAAGVKGDTQDVVLSENAEWTKVNEPKKYKFVEVTVPKDQTVSFGGEKPDIKDVKKVESGKEVDVASIGDTGLGEGIYRLAADLKKDTKFSKGVSIKLVSEAPTV
ncbi:MAG: hypothetical protein WC269_02365 [Candidatus Gracilibacteria bacterium]|jgi:hypothetical protein